MLVPVRTKVNFPSRRKGLRPVGPGLHLNSSVKPDHNSCRLQGERFCAGNEKQDSRTIESEDPTATCVVRHSTLTGKANRRVQAPTLRKQELIASFFLNGIPGTRYLFILWLPLWGRFFNGRPMIPSAVARNAPSPQGRPVLVCRRSISMSSGSLARKLCRSSMSVKGS